MQIGRDRWEYLIKNVPSRFTRVLVAQGDTDYYRILVLDDDGIQWMLRDHNLGRISYRVRQSLAESLPKYNLCSDIATIDAYAIAFVCLQPGNRIPVETGIYYPAEPTFALIRAARPIDIFRCLQLAVQIQPDENVLSIILSTSSDTWYSVLAQLPADVRIVNDYATGQVRSGQVQLITTAGLTLSKLEAIPEWKSALSQTQNAEASWPTIKYEFPNSSIFHNLYKISAELFEELAQLANARHIGDET